MQRARAREGEPARAESQRRWALAAPTTPNGTTAKAAVLLHPWDTCVGLGQSTSPPATLLHLPTPPLP